MAKLWASAPREEFGAGRSHAGREPTGDRQEPALDAEMQEVVQRFEQAYAGFPPDAEEAPPQRPAAAAEPFPEFADVFQDAPPLRATAPDSARVVAMPRREPEAAAPSAPPPRARERAEMDDSAIDLDEAMAILRAPELRSAPAPQTGIDAEAAKVLASNDAAPRTAPRSTSRRIESEAPTTASSNWARRSHAVRTIAVGAALVALAVGAAGGYLLGRGPLAKSPSAQIDATKQGGTQLRLERNLPQR
jgi:hypothetical protein